MDNKEISTDPEKLRVYKNNKLELADHLRSIIQALKILNREETKKGCEELMVKLAEDRFTLAVLGEFKRGKSSLMNAIIGRNLLPVGMLPVTSAITILRYGSPEKLIVNRHSSLLLEELPVSMLCDYITMKGNPENKKNVSTVYLDLSIPFLQMGIELVDTPGIGSVINDHTLTTYDFLPSCDAVLFVTSADMPMSNAELDFLFRIKKYCNKIFFIINKIDLISINERTEILEFAIQTIGKQMYNAQIKIFPVSSLQGLQAKIDNNPLLHGQSGLKTLEEALTTFLSGEKYETFLEKITGGILQILNDEKISRQNAGDTSAELYAATEEIEERYNKIKELHEAIGNKKITAINVNTKASLQAEVWSEEAFADLFISNKHEDRKPEEIMSDMGLRSCSVCDHVAGQANAFFSGLQYQLVTNERTRYQFAEQLGFCPLHTWQLLSISSPYGASIGYAKLSEEISNRLQAFSGNTIKGVLKNMIKNTTNCSACKMLKNKEDDYIQQLAMILQTDEGRQTYSRSEGVCLWHLSMLTDIFTTADLKDFLLRHAARSFRQDAEDMCTYVLKRDALKRSLLNRNEKDAYIRTITRMVGSRAVCLPWAMDGEI
jgi:predicted GTPase